MVAGPGLQSPGGSWAEPRPGKTEGVQRINPLAELDTE